MKSVRCCPFLFDVLKKKKKKNEMNSPPVDRLPKLPKISVVNKSQNEEEAFELRSQLEVIYQYWSVCL